MKSKIVKRKKKEVDTIAGLQKEVLAAEKKIVALERKILKMQTKKVKPKKAARPQNKPFDNCVMKDFPDK